MFYINGDATGIPYLYKNAEFTEKATNKDIPLDMSFLINISNVQIAKPVLLGFEDDTSISVIVGAPTGAGLMDYIVHTAEYTG